MISVFTAAGACCRAACSVMADDMQTAWSTNKVRAGVVRTKRLQVKTTAGSVFSPGKITLGELFFLGKNFSVEKKEKRKKKKKKKKKKRKKKKTATRILN